MANLHLIIGADDFLVGETARKVIGDGTGLEVIDSINSTNAELQLRDLREADASFSTPPFLDPRKVTWWRNVHFLPGGGKKSGDEDGGKSRESSEEVKEALERFAEKLAANPLPENQAFILSGPRLLATSRFAKILAAAAEVVTFAAPKPWEAARAAEGRAAEMAADLGLSFAPGAASAFVATVGADTRTIRGELEKLRCYLGGDGGKVTAADVAAVSSPGAGVEPAVWDVTDAIAARDVAAALAALRRFEGTSGFAVFMSGAIEKLFRQMIDVKEGRTQGLNPFVVRKTAGFLRNWTPAELRAARARFLMLRERVVSGLTSGDTLVFTEVVRVCRRSAARARG